MDASQTVNIITFLHHIHQLVYYREVEVSLVQTNPSKLPSFTQLKPNKKTN